jgi:hypothetical protein
MVDPGVSANESASYASTSLQEIARGLESYLDSRVVDLDGSILLVKGRLDTVRDLEIVLYPKDHLPPHFHVISRQRGIDARLSIETLDVLSEKYGKIKSDDVKKVQGFYRDYPERYEVLKREYDRLK